MSSINQIDWQVNMHVGEKANFNLSLRERLLELSRKRSEFSFFMHQSDAELCQNKEFLPFLVSTINELLDNQEVLLGLIESCLPGRESDGVLQSGAKELRRASQVVSKK